MPFLSSSSFRSFPLRALNLLMLCLLLNACGGSGGDDPAPVAAEVQRLGPGNADNPTVIASTKGSGNVTVGGITGFGSIIVEGIKYEDDQTSVWIETDADSARPAATTALKIGMQVELSHERGQAAGVTIRSALRGPVTSVDAASGLLTLLGQQVQVVGSGPDATVFDGLASLADLKAGDWLEIHGMDNAAGSLTASRIERTLAGEPMRVKLSGRIAMLDLKSQTMRVGAMLVDFRQAALLDTGALANGQRVAVFANSLPAGDRLIARSLRAADAALTRAAQAVIGGQITDFASAADLRVAGVPVDASGAIFVEGSAADLADGATVRVDGEMHAGVMVAARVEFRKGASAAARNDIKGTVTDFVSVSNFKVRGQKLDASRAQFIGGSATELINGSMIAVVGRIVDGALQADQVTFQTLFTEGTSATFDGSIVSLRGRAGTFRLGGMPMVLAADVRVLNESLSSLWNGRRVAVTGSFTSEHFQVQTLEFRDHAPSIASLTGIASDVGADRLTVSAARILLDDSTGFVNGSRADLVDGQTVKVSAIRNQVGDLVARTIELPPSLPAGGVEVHGLISDFVSVGDLRIAGQRADASGAAFDFGTMLTALMNGKMADGIGVIENGVLRLRTLVVRDAN